MTHDQAILLLKDIEGLHPGLDDGTITSLLVSGVVLLCLVMYLVWRYFTSKSPWQIQACEKIQQLQQQVNVTPAKVILDDFSPLMRRIAMARLGRRSCAGLKGDAWLAWLQSHDPKGFAWTQYTEYLTQLRYAPEDEPIALEPIKQMLAAAMHWARKL